MLIQAKTFQVCDFFGYQRHGLKTAWRIVWKVSPNSA